MKATIFLPSGETRVLDEQELFTLYVLREQLMGLPVLCADGQQAARVLGFASVQVLAQTSRYVVFAGLEMKPGTPYQPPAFNPVAGAHLRSLGVLYCQPCPSGPVLVIETVAVPQAQQPGQRYALAF